ncbi:ninein isoform X5 [Erpetoichthys calabaricus]|uniref:ninein isoform X5 n=1 Tax=Erpetoichthys calabaricus TaxID=27687 RepID=UPI002234148E|nr:ninein isoform X5 [Erpetoichthys calabaricus]
MDEAQQNQYELRLKEVFDTFDSSNSGSLCLEELSELCQVLHLQEVEPLLLEALLTETDSKSRVHFEAFKEALIFVLSTTIEAQTFTEEDFQQQPESVEVDPKFVKDGKRYGRRSAPELGELAEGLTDKALSHGIQENSSPYTPNDCENLRALEHRSEEYEAEGQLRFWNPDDLGASRTGVSLSSDGLEEHLAEVFNELGVSCNGYASHKELVQVCERLGLETLEDSLVNVDSNGTCSVKDFICAILRNRKPPTPSASTPYRQLKRHLSTQPFDESGRRTATPSAMASTIGLRLFSSLDDGSGYTPADQVMDAWQEEGIDNSHEILQALDFNTEGKVNLSELTVALENELLITKNGIHQAVLASFKTEIRHLLERLDHEVREKEKVRNDLDKADKFKTQMATEVDEHHSALERLNDYNIRKLSVEYRERLVAVKAELTNERDVILHQASKHRQDLEKKIEGMKEEEAYLRDRLTLAFKENSRLETELLENMDKLIESENLASKLQKNLDSILGERFGDLDPSSAEFFLQEERLRKMRATYEEQCRELQDRIDELQLELEEYRTQSKVFRTPVKHSLLEEFDTKNDGINLDPGVGSEEAHPLNISLEAEMMMEQMKEHHRQDVASIQTELEGKFENKLEEIEAAHKLEVQNLERHCQEQKKENVQAQSLVKDLFAQVETLNVQLETAKQLQEQEREDLVSQVKGEISELEKQWAEKVGVAQAQISELQQQHVEEMNQSKTQILELESKHREEVAFVRADISKLEKEHAEELRLSQAHISEMEEKWEREKHAHATDRAELVKQHAVEVSQLEARITELEMCHAEEVKQSEARIAELSLDLQKMEQTYRDEMTMLEKKHMEEQARLEKLSDESQREHVAAERDKLLAELELKEEQLMKQFSGEKALLEQQHIMVLEELNSKHCEEKDKLTGILEKLEKKLHDERLEASRLAEQNISLKEELKENHDLALHSLKGLGGTQEEILCTAEKLKAEKTSAKKMVDTLRAQLAEVRTRSEQLERENAELSFKIGQLLRHKEKRESGRRSHSHQLEEMNKGKDALIAELGSEKKQIISRLSALEVELTKVHERSVSLEQEKTRLSQELFAAKEQLAKAIQMQSELSNKSEKLSKEKEVLSEELNRCVDKVAKAASLESQLAHLKTDRQAAEQLVGILKSQLSTSQEKVHSLDEALQNSNLQMSRLKSDLRVSQQEKETLKHEVMSLHKQLQNANDKNQVLELSLHSAGYQNQHKKLYWDDLTRLVEQEQQLLRQENERLQKEMQNTKGDLQHSREKIRQLEAGVLSLKQHKQQNQSSLVKVLEQEKLALQRDLEQMHKELLAANRKLSDLSDSVQEVENLKMENENLRVMLSRMERELLETQQYFQAQHRLLQTERRGASRAQEPASMAPDLNMQQESRDAMLLRMEERMRSVEQNLHNVKLLLQEKVNQLKDQLQKNVKADEMIKDLYVENSQLLKALEMTEQRQKVTEKKNYLLEEKIASLNKIVRDLSPSPIAAMPYHFSRS